MNDQLIRDLLHEVADDVEPGDRLDAIRAATAPTRRTHRGWWAAGAGLVAASVVAAFALTTGGAPQTGGPGPADRPSASPTAPGDDATAPGRDQRAERLEEMRRTAEGVHAVYYVGDTPVGPRIYREFLTMDPEDTLSMAVSAALGRTTDGRPLPAEEHDPDYRSPWPAMTTASASLSADGDALEVSLGGDPEGDLRTRGTLSAQEAAMAVEAMVRTAQAAVGERLPVRFDLYGEPAATVLGVDTSAPVQAGSDLDVLSHVSLSDPFEGQVADNDEPFVVRGAANSFEGNVVTRIQRWEGTAVVAEQPAIAGWNADRLFPFEVTFDLTDVPPGDYVVISQTDDPSGRGEVFTDTRRITVVD